MPGHSKIYPIPRDELARLKTLHDHDLLDTTFDPDFDDVVQLAAVICEAPISLVTFLDEDRQVFKARLGLRSTGTSRSISFCTHAITQRELFVVPDAQLDERFRDNPDVAGGVGVRFYAGMPILSPQDVVLGTLCVIDHRPRTLDARQRESLRILSRIVRSHVKQRIASNSATRAKAA